ncbi:hypothetical protein FB446DRAFT_723654 [Lentinula raphanica]|nr:hypothetical protein FB446DRAFT_723654 [Lentinula raphanica]
MVSHGCAMTSCILIPSSGETSTSFPKDFLTDLPLRLVLRVKLRDNDVRIVPMSCTCAQTKFLKAYRGRHQRFSDSWYPLASHHPRTIAPAARHSSNDSQPRTGKNDLDHLLGMSMPYERRPCKTLQNRLKSMIGLSNRSGRWWSVGAIGSCNTL